MRTSIALLALLVSAMTGCQKQPDGTTAQGSRKESSGGNPITAPVDYLGAVAQAKKASEKTVGLTSLNQAIQLFNAQEDRFPSDLNELVTKKYLPNLPVPPTGTRIAYDPRTGEVKFARQ